MVAAAASSAPRGTPAGRARCSAGRAGRGGLYFDSFLARPADVIGLEAGGATPASFADDFETGDYLAWSSVQTTGGDLGVNSQAAIVGDAGLWVESGYEGYVQSRRITLVGLTISWAMPWAVCASWWMRMGR